MPASDREGRAMRLGELEKFNQITIQCHDNPDADAIASGFALYTFFQEKGKTVRLIYAGRNKIQKTNLLLMLDKLQIPIEYLTDTSTFIKGLLITVDCQYGAGNVTKLESEEQAIIDHHQVETAGIALSEIRSYLGSCSTLVWKLMIEEGFSFKEKSKLGTALYYGLYSDTNQFSEIYNPLDMDMRDAVPCEKSLINMFRNANLSLKELEIAGVALIKHIYNEDNHFAIIRSHPCDPNILGLISDFLLQVDEVHTCVVYNELPEGIKFSVRSCVKEVRADELANYLAGDMGSGGGHSEKAGGFINMQKYNAEYGSLTTEAYFGDRMNVYFRDCKIIEAATYDIDITNMPSYCKKKIPRGYVTASDVLPVGTPITIRTLEGDVDMTIEEDLIIMIGPKGEVYPSHRNKFEKSYEILSEKYNLKEYAPEAEYIPTIRNRIDGSAQVLTDYAGVCCPLGEVYIHARELTETVKVFTEWDPEKYMLGRAGDYLAVRCDDLHDIYVVEKNIFQKTYEKK